MKQLLPIILVFIFGCKESKKQLPPLEICQYDSNDLKENFAASNIPYIFSKGKPIKPPRTQTSSYACIYLDMDGEVGTWAYWNGGNKLTLAPPALTTQQKIEILNEVYDQYLPYNVVVTDSLSVYEKADPKKRIRVIVTATEDWYNGVTGIGYTGSLTWGDGTPVFVFSDRLYNGSHFTAEIACHESGHAAGLRHQSVYNADGTLQTTYRRDVKMGNGLYVQNSPWSNGTTTAWNVYQDGHATLLAVYGARK